MLDFFFILLPGVTATEPTRFEQSVTSQRQLPGRSSGAIVAAAQSRPDRSVTVTGAEVRAGAQIAR